MHAVKEFKQFHLRQATYHSKTNVSIQRNDYRILFLAVLRRFRFNRKCNVVELHEENQLKKIIKQMWLYKRYAAKIICIFNCRSAAELFSFFISALNIETLELLSKKSNIRKQIFKCLNKQGQYCYQTSFQIRKASVFLVLLPSVTTQDF